MLAFVVARNVNIVNGLISLLVADLCLTFSRSPHRIWKASYLATPSDMTDLV